MYLFMFGYPIVVLMSFMILLRIQVRDIFEYFKRTYLLLIVPIPVITLLLRIIRSSMITPFSSSYFWLQLLYVVGIPLILFMYCYLVLLRVSHHKSSTQYSSVEKTSSLSYLSTQIILIVLVNEFLISLMTLIINNMFFNWIDIFLVPLIRMALAQSIILLSIQVTQGYFEYIQSRSLSQMILRLFSFGLVSIIMIILGTLSLQYYATSFFIYAHIFLILTIVTGWGCVYYLGREFQILVKGL